MLGMSTSGIAGFAIIGTVISFVLATYKKLVAYALKFKRVFIKEVHLLGVRSCRNFVENMLSDGYELPITSAYFYEIKKYNNFDRQCKEKVGIRSLPNEKSLYRKKFSMFSMEVRGSNNITINYFRFFKGVDKMVIDSIMSEEGAEANRRHRYYYRKVTGMGESSEGESEDKSGPGKSYSHFAYPETVIFLNGEIDSAPFVSEGNVKDDMVYCWNDECENAEMEFKYWLESEDWHKSRKIMWKRSFCLYGPPGTGKTSFVRYLGHKYGMPVIAFDLATFDNAMFSGEWAKAINGHSPCIVLIEDIDAVFNGRENVCNKNSMRQMLTFDCLLNCLDGVENNDGLFVVITTNHLEKLDPALLRAGRVDRKIKIGNMAIEQRRQLAKKLINHMDEDSIDGLVEETEGMTAANVSRRFVEVALDNHWRNFDEQILDSVEKTSIKNEEFVTA
jgi:hypothetical protein